MYTYVSYGIYIYMYYSKYMYVKKIDHKLSCKNNLFYPYFDGIFIGLVGRVVCSDNHMSPWRAKVYYLRS